MGTEVRYAVAIVTNDDNRIISMDFGTGTHRFGYIEKHARLIADDNNVTYKTHNYRWVAVKITTTTEIIG